MPGHVAAEDILLAARQWHDPSFYAAWLARDGVDIHLAEADLGRAAIGYVAPVPHEESRRLEIKRIYLLHRFQGTGLGHRLMEAALGAARARKAAEVCLDVAEFNAHAIAFYTSFSFRIASTRRSRRRTTAIRSTLSSRPCRCPQAAQGGKAQRVGNNSSAPAIRRRFCALRCSKTHAGRRQAAPLTRCSEFLPTLEAHSTIFLAARKPVNCASLIHDFCALC
jgi:GNAT superfamily N-acetyltransferase